MKPEELIIGVDPGTAVTGYGIIRVTGRGYAAVSYGCIRTSPSTAPPERYKQIYEELSTLLEKHAVSALAIELQFLGDNFASVLKLGMARGVAELAASLRHIPIFGYTPSQAKRAVVGKGSASKEQVQKMVRTLLSLPAVPQDAADAFALAICHTHNKRKPLCMNS